MGEADAERKGGVNERPQRPQASEEVHEWFDSRFEPYAAIQPGDLRAIWDDVPASVREYVEAWELWHIADLAWRAERPIDRPPLADAFRMFGGPWLPVYLVLEGSERELNVLATMRDLMDKGAPDEELRRFAGAMYEWHHGATYLADKVIALADELHAESEQS